MLLGCAAGEAPHLVQVYPLVRVNPGVIAGQDLKAGTALARDSYVYLTTSIGPPMETSVGF
jgi:beta-lactam-binding protein with PASTA domain